MRAQAAPGTAAVLTLSLGNAIAIGDPALLSSNIAVIRNDLQLSLSTASLVAAGAFLTLAATILGAGAMGDKFGGRRMLLVGACGAVAFGLLTAAAPNVVVLVGARVGAGVSFGFLLCLSLAIVNAAFPPERIPRAIALFVAATTALAIVPPIVGSLLIDHFGWRSGFLVTPTLALILIALAVRLVPETPRSDRSPDVIGMLLAAVSLIPLLLGISRLQEGLSPAVLIPIVVGLLGAGVFWWWESHTAVPALDPRIFRSAGFSAATVAAAVYAFVMGGSGALLTSYIVIVRGAPATALHLLYIPGALLAALTAIVAGRLAARYGGSAVMVGGLLLLAAAMATRFLASDHTAMSIVALMMAAGAIAGAVVQTALTTVLMTSAPARFGGVVSALRSNVQSTAYAFGSAFFPLLGVTLFGLMGGRKFAGEGVTAEQARDILRVSHLHGASQSIPSVHLHDPQRTEWVISAARSTWMDVGRTLSVTMSVALLAAAGLTLAILRPDRAPRGRGIGRD
ncbi:MAG: MFS transporter [Mycobacterium sp.]|nr:MFS transporter [Mycobacterium sp.]